MADPLRFISMAKAGHSGDWLSNPLFDSPVSALAFSPDGWCVAVGGSCGRIALVDTVQRETLWLIGAHHDAVQSLAWSPNGKTLASLGGDQTLAFWQAQHGRCFAQVRPGNSPGGTIAWSPAGGYLASIAGKTLRLWDECGQLLDEDTAYDRTLRALAWRPDGQVLAATAFGLIRHYAFMQEQPPSDILSARSYVSLAWRPDGGMLAAGTQGEELHGWWFHDKAFGAGFSHQSAISLGGFVTPVDRLSWSARGDKLAAGLGDRVVSVDITDDHTFQPHPPRLVDAPLLGVGFRAHDDGLTAVSARSLFQWQPGTQTAQQQALPGPATAAAHGRQAIAIGLTTGQLLLVPGY